jgi:hypothetical protein
MIQLYIPLVSLIVLLAFYFVSYDILFNKKAKLEQFKKTNEEENNTPKYYGWGLHYLI